MFKKIKAWFGIVEPRPIDIYDVFTPTKPATYTFVERNKVDKELVNAIKTPGKQIVVYGHSGSGKSTLLINKIKDQLQIIASRCTQNTKFSDLQLDCFDQLNAYYLERYSETEENKRSGSIDAELLTIKSNVNEERSKSSAQDFSRMAPVQLNLRRLALDLNNNNCCWIIEDFHKVAIEEKQQLADAMKLFTDLQAKVIAIGAVGTAREVVEQNPEMQNRVAEILVPLMEDDEIGQIIEKGEQVLNLNIEDHVKSSIIKFSNGLAAVCHQLCLNLCREKDISTRSNNRITLTDEDLGKAINSYLSEISDTLKATFDKAIKRDDEDVQGVHEKILKVFLLSENDELSIREISEYLRRFDDRHYASLDIKKYLTELGSEKRGTVVRYDSNSNKYSFSNPFFTAYCHCLLRKELQEIEKATSSNKAKSLDIEPDYAGGPVRDISHNIYLKNYCINYVDINDEDITERAHLVLENWDKYQNEFEKLGFSKEQFREAFQKYLTQRIKKKEK